MKQKRTGTILIVFGVVLAAVVAGLMYFVANQAEKPTIPTEAIVVATQDIGERTIIPANALTTKRMPIDVIPAGALKRLEEAVGHMTVVKIQTGEVILANKLADTKGQSGVSFTIERGKVVVTFPASNLVGLGLVRPGDTVDLLVTYKPSTNRLQPTGPSTPDVTMPNETQTTMQNLKVLTIGPLPQAAAQQQQQQQNNQANANFVTFAVDPQDALFLKSIKDADTLVVEMALRAAADEDMHKTDPVSLQDVLSRYGIRLSADQPAARR